MGLAGAATAEVVTERTGGSAPRWIDNHCHLVGGEDPGAVVADAVEAGVEAFVTVGTDAGSSRACLDLAAAFDQVWATAGVHPHDAKGGVDELIDVVEEAVDAADGRLVAIGECGMDRHYDHSPPDAQRRAFARQIELANRVGLPLVIHTREAWDDTFDLLAEYGVPDRTVFHCFTGGPVEMERCLAIGASVSISGIVTFRNATDLRAAVATAPLDRLMVETDSPYLAPVPHRGRVNRPAYVTIVGAEVARIHRRPVGEVAALTTANARRFYGLDDGRRASQAFGR